MSQPLVTAEIPMPADLYRFLEALALESDETLSWAAVELLTQAITGE